MKTNTPRSGGAQENPRHADLRRLASLLCFSKSVDDIDARFFEVSPGAPYLLREAWPEEYRGYVERYGWRPERLFIFASPGLVRYACPQCEPWPAFGPRPPILANDIRICLELAERSL